MVRSRHRIAQLMIAQTVFCCKRLCVAACVLSLRL